MALVMGGTEVGMREIGRNVTIPADNRARLMYYLDTICSLLDMSDTNNLSRLRNYSQYYSLSEEEVDALVLLCFVLSPDELNGKVMFQSDQLCGDDNNKFLELSAVQSNMILSDNILIAGQRRSVTKIMVFKVRWMDTNWTNPMKAYTLRLARLATGQGGGGGGGARAVQQPARPAIEYRPAATQPRPTYTTQPRPTYTSSYQPTYHPPKSSSCCTIL